MGKSLAVNIPEEINSSLAAWKNAAALALSKIGSEPLLIPVKSTPVVP
jgi:hypothetical protein